MGILIFDGVEELDFAGPWEVFTAANRDEPKQYEVFLVAEREGVVTCAKGMRVLPDKTTANCGRIDILVVPGGIGTRREEKNPALLEWVSRTAKTCTWITSVCTGARILGAAGLLKGKRITTHWSSIEEVRGFGYSGEVLENVRYVRDGNVVTAAGVSAGIDMALWLVGELRSPDFARQVQKYIEYYPAPPYGEV